MLQQKFSFMVFVLGLSKIKNCGVIIICHEGYKVGPNMQQMLSPQCS